MQLIEERLVFSADAGQTVAMTPRIDPLDKLCRDFANAPGEIAICVKSKRDPSLAVSINERQPIASASTVKAAIACAAMARAASGELDLRQTISKSALDDTFYCSILEAFDAEETLSLRALIGLMLIVSDNPATTAVLDAVGMAEVNAWFAQNGLAQTSLSVGFDDASLGAPLRANLTTAEDCLTLLEAIDTQPVYGAVKHMLQNNLRNERIPKLLPDDARIAHKTGTLSGLVHDIAIVDSPSANYYLIVLADGVANEADFAHDLATFSEAIYQLMSE